MWACAVLARAALPDSLVIQLTETYTTAMKAFEAGRWTEAAAGLSKLVAKVTDPADQAKIGPVYYTVGAAHYNAKQYPQAAAAFQIFLTKFPDDPRARQARLAQARATYLAKQYEAAIPLFAAYEGVPAMRYQSLLVQAECFKALKKDTEQMAVLERLMLPDIGAAQQAEGALTLIELYFHKNETDKALELLNKLHARIAVVDNVVALNLLTVKLGDELAEKKAYEQALRAYREVRTREQVLDFQTNRIAALEQRIQANQRYLRSGRLDAVQVASANQELEAAVEHARKLLAVQEKMPDHLPGVVLRMGRVYYDWGRKWEAISAFDSLLAEHPKTKECEPALYAMLVCYADLNRVARTQAMCERYLKEFPKGPNAAGVGYLLGAVSLEAGEPKRAATFFGRILDEQPQSPLREQLILGLGNSYAMMGQHVESRREYRRYLRDFPKGQFLEDALYREALATVFLGEYEAALKSLNAYVQKYPQGAYAADAGYRLMVCKYAGSLYGEVVADAQQWHKKFPNHQIAGEIFAVTADAHAAENKHAEAAAAYQQAFKRASTDEVLNYALFEAGKQLQKLGDWPAVAKMFEDFVRDNPNHASVVAAMYWISRAKQREGKPEEAKALIITQLKRDLNEPKREAVEQLLQQLAQLCAKRPRPPALPAADTNAVAAAAATNAPAAAATNAVAVAPPLPPPYDPFPELKQQLEPLADLANATGRARLLYAEAELCKLRRQNADVQDIYDRLAKDFTPEQLSPVLLALVGDHLLEKGDRVKAAKFFEDLREDYPKSNYLDFAFNGLGEIALAGGQARKALELFTTAADDLAALKIKDATLGKARALLELGKYPEAKKLFAQVASTREWRGESTAAAVFYLGELEAKQGRYPEAIAHYQRVFVAYQKFLPWTARAYVRGADCFDKLGKRAEAIGHLREMLRNAKLKDFPETEQARKLLDTWGAAS